MKTAEEFRKNWQRANPNTIHIPSEHELFLMEAYANQDRWISVETPPEMTEPFWAYNDENVREIWFENDHAIVFAHSKEIGIFKAKFGKTGWSEISSISSKGIKDVTHWQPLPLPPNK